MVYESRLERGGILDPFCLLPQILMPSSTLNLKCLLKFSLPIPRMAVNWNYLAAKSFGLVLRSMQEFQPLRCSLSLRDLKYQEHLVPPLMSPSWLYPPRLSSLHFLPMLQLPLHA